MGQTFSFTKMHGCGNDYIYVNCFTQHIDDPAAVSIIVSDRHCGIGGDGLVLICPSEIADVRMRIFNADGSEAEMCGNATRCVARYAHEHGLAKGDTVRIETGCGVKEAKLLMEDGHVCGATVDMGEPVLAAGSIPVRLPEGFDTQAFFQGQPFTVDGTEWQANVVSMGNPHNVLFLDDTRPALEELDLAKTGPAFENHVLFPERVNTEFVRVESDSSVSMRVWERGSGETMACGTGACAVAVACIKTGRTKRTVSVHLKGGTLTIFWDQESNHVFMTGPATHVFDGVITV